MSANHLNRRQFAKSAAATIIAANVAPTILCAPNQTNDFSVGLLLGSLLGDAMGGPLEFASDENRKGNVVAARQWDASRQLDDDTISKIGGI